MIFAQKLETSVLRVLWLLEWRFKDLSDEGTTAPLDYCVTAVSCDINRDKHNVRTAVQASSLASAIGSGQGASRHPLPVSGTPKEQTSKKAQAPLPRPATSTGSRPSSSAGARVAPTPPALAILQSDVQIVSAIPASDPVVSIHHPVNLRFSPCTTGSTKRSEQVQARLDQAIREGQVPSYCENCGSIETPTWRRAWSRDVEGSEKVAEVMMRDYSGLFWLALEHNAQGEMQKFKIYTKGPGKTVNEWVQMLFCNPCGLWLYRFKSMRPENRWNEKLLEKKKNRPSRNRKTGPLSSCPASRTWSKVASNKPLASSPAPTELFFIPIKEETPNMSNIHDNDDEADPSPLNRRREISAEPRRLTYTAEHRWHEQHPMEALQRAFQSNPARNMEVRLISRTGNKASPQSICSPQCNARIASKDDKRDDEQDNHAITPHDDPGRLFKSPTVDFDLPTSPTPRRHHLLIKNRVDNWLSLPSASPSLNEGKNMSSPITPAHLSVERMQYIRESQQGHRSQQRQQISPNKQHIFPSLPHDGLHPQAFEYHTEMILDIFDGASSQPNSSLQLENTNIFVGDKWADLLPSNYVSTADSDDGPSDDIQKINLLDSEFGILDSGLFSSDTPHTDPFRMGTKKKPAGQEHGSQQAIS
ncbi:hypothetical protein N7449_005070 [Penicillium cf. viridicatum]|uniref:Uncharacterized protein n=1 Tax=Penicillium cf. viridicatum TaxID=2972119 RepID=A0A9W9MKE9_9EURO|nr:hypothetical protein N7449_005070 [Penicillium cf. viridicatum]